MKIILLVLKQHIDTTVQDKQKCYSP